LQHPRKGRENRRPDTNGTLFLRGKGGKIAAN
jgi:hypothetical protein